MARERSGAQVARLDVFHLVHAPLVTILGAEGGTQKGFHDLTRYVDTHYPGAEAQHVHVIVLDRLVSRVAVMAN
jgi:hypothetical protein